MAVRMLLVLAGAVAVVAGAPLAADRLRVAETPSATASALAATDDLHPLFQWAPRHDDAAVRY